MNLERIAILKAKQSYCRFRVSAIALDRSGKVIATAVNSPFLNKKGGGIHAELKAWRKGGPRTHSIVICRIGWKDTLLPIDCCEYCKKVLDKHGIKVYTLR